MGEGSSGCAFLPVQKLFYRPAKKFDTTISHYYKEDLMGKGDRRSRRGKLFRGTYGNKRPHKKEKNPAAKPAV
jgi:30S ribosomal protein S31